MSFKLSVNAVSERNLKAADKREHLLWESQIAAIEHHGTTGITVASRYIFAHSVRRKSIFKIFVSHLNITMIALYKKRPALVRWSSGSVAGSVGANVQHFSEITFSFMLNAYLRYIFTSIFAVFSVVAAVPQRYLPPHRRPRLGQHERIYVLKIFCHLVFVIMLAWLLHGQEKWFFIDSKDSLDALLML